MKSAMPSLFNLLRVCIYCATLVFTLICLGMAGRFITALEASDLTRFVPFAIFVCAASLLIIVSLLGFSFLFRERNPISTRIELGCLGLTGLLWLVLGVYLVTSQSKDADVECFSSETSTTVLDDELASFHTDQYQAMYRVLNAFALLNAILLLGFFFCILILAIRRHRRGDVHMWIGPVTSCAWFNNYSSKAKGQPARSRSYRQAPTLPTQAPPPPPMKQIKTSKTNETFTPPPVKRERSSRTRDYGELPRRQHSSRSQGQSRPHRERSHRHRSQSRTRDYSGSSLMGSTADEYETGRLANPNRTTSTRRTNY